MQDFEFQLDLVKAESTSDGRLIVSGVASTTGVDLQNDAFSENALKSMAASALGKPLVINHNEEIGDDIGSITKANVDGDKLWIEGELDKDDAMAVRLFKKIQKSPSKAGFSVGASLIRAKPGTGVHKSVRVIDDVKLHHIMLTNKPVNRDTFAVAIHKAITNFADSNIVDIEKAADVSADQRKEHATYFENGEGKFPIFDKATAESALHLIGHAPPDKQETIRKRACAILGKDHPACGDGVNKSEDVHMETQTDINKAGAKFSEATKAKMMAIHDGTDDDAVKAGIKNLLADETDETIMPPDMTEAEPESTSDPVSDAPASMDDMPPMPADAGQNAAPDDKFIGVVQKAVDEAVAAKQAELDAKIADLDSKAKLLEEAVKMFKSQSENISKPKEPEVIVKPIETTELRKAHLNESDLFKHLLLRANQGG